MVALHTLCCGVPALVLLVSMALGAAAGGAAWLGAVEHVHAFLHGHEVWVLALSGLLVAAGGLGELAMRRGGDARGFPALFALSVGALALNIGVFAVHHAV